jgi:hypothetical protein
VPRSSSLITAISGGIGEIKQNNNLTSKKTVILPRKAVSELNKILEHDGELNSPLIEIDQLLKNKFDIHYKNLNGVHNLTNTKPSALSFAGQAAPKI